MVKRLGCVRTAYIFQKYIYYIPLSTFCGGSSLGSPAFLDRSELKDASDSSFSVLFDQRIFLQYSVMSCIYSVMESIASHITKILILALITVPGLCFHSCGGLHVDLEELNKTLVSIEDETVCSQ